MFLAKRAELVVFPPESPIVEQYQRLGNPVNYSELSSFIRPVDIREPFFSFASLERVLGRTDKELVRVADLCEAEVVPHTWGLISGHTSTQYHQTQVRGYSLVAEVDRIKCTSDGHPSSGYNAERFHTIYDGLTKYKKPWPISRYKLSDMEYGQFLFGINLNKRDSGSNPGLFLVDIEPLYRMRTGIYF